tara:strand:- start:472 stop:861 length:390 start_codon:yes stop_codon:yes gene_type:complete
MHNIIEKMEGNDMRDFILKNKKAVDINQVRDIGKQLIQAICYLQENRIIHRDLKPENILFNKEMKQIKVIDLGLSTRFEQTAKEGEVLGTMRYMSPEQLGGILSFKSDIWAFGCILLEFLTGVQPYEGL